MRAKSNKEIAKAFSLLGIRSVEVAAALDSPSVEIAEKRIKELQDKAKRRLRQRARDLHPDLTGGDEEKTEELKQLNDAFNTIKNLKPVLRVTPSTYSSVIVTGQGSMVIQYGTYTNHVNSTTGSSHWRNSI